MIRARRDVERSTFLLTEAQWYATLLRMAHAELSPNQIVAYNLEKLRRERGWTALETAKRLGALLGRNISLASYSAMERSVEGRRIKSFDADEIFCLARLFGVRVWFLFIPPINFRLRPVRVRPKGAPADQSLARSVAAALIVETPEDIFADMAARAAGAKRLPKRAEPKLSLSDPVDAAVFELVLHMMKRPSPTSAPEQQKQSQEFVAFLKEIQEARQKRPAMLKGSRSSQKPEKVRSKRR